MIALKDLFFRLAPFRPLPADRAVILMYHSVSDRKDYFSSVSPEDFAQQMRFLKERNYEVIPLPELVRRLREGEALGGTVAITFDDGYRDNATAAFPVLKAYGFPATIFVTTGLIGESDKRGLDRMTAQEIRELRASGFISIQPHTRTHPRLTSLTEEQARDEVEDSKRALEALLAETCTLFAYPYGNYDAYTARVVQECGFSGAVTVREGTVGPDAEPYELPRVSLDRSTTWAQFLGKLSTTVDRYERLKLWR